MPLEYTREEVKEFLVENGFPDPDEDTLTKFIKDLQKLIKYEQQRRRRHLLGHGRDETALDTTTDTSREVTGSSSPGLNNTSSFCNERENTGHSERQQSRRTSRGTGEEPFRTPLSPKRRSFQTQEQSVASCDHTSRNGTSRASDNHPEDYAGHRKSWSASARKSRDEERLKKGDVTDSKGTRKVSSVPKESAQEKYDRLLASMSTTAGRSSAENPPRKSQGNRLIMKRLTATQADDGTSFIEESDVDLGRLRRMLPPKKKPLAPRPVNRPQTAPPPATRPSHLMSAKSVEDKPRNSATRRMSSIPEGPGTRKASPESVSPEEIEPDELFYALNELIFPSGSEGSDESLSTISEKYKSLPQPPPHVAIDPVALYHWYKTYGWDVFAIPGEDRHMKLRWNVRAKTLTGHHRCVEAKRRVRKMPSGISARNPSICKY